MSGSVVLFPAGTSVGSSRILKLVLMHNSSLLPAPHVGRD